MRRVILAAVSTIAGLTMLLSFKTQPRTSVATPPTAAGSPTIPSSNPETTGDSASAPSTTGTTNGTATKTVTGDAADTRYGPVEVKITVTNGQVSAVDAVEYPQDTPKDYEINSYAIPQLNQEAVAAKSAQIDMVSGATYTSDGYITSLQSALNKAGLA